jgi:hypothetical protein
MGGEKPDCVGADMTSLHAAMTTPAGDGIFAVSHLPELSRCVGSHLVRSQELSCQSSRSINGSAFAHLACTCDNLQSWAKYGLSDKMAAGGQCSPVNVSAVDNCFQGNVQNWDLWCGASGCLNDLKWLSKQSGNHNSTHC